MSRHHRRSASVPSSLQHSRVYRLDARPINGQVLSSENVDLLLGRWTRILPHSAFDLLLLPPTIHLDLGKIRGYADDGIAMEAIETFFWGGYQPQQNGRRRKCFLRSAKIANVETVEVVEDWMNILSRFGGAFLEEVVLKDVAFHSSIVDVIGSYNVAAAAKYASTIQVRSKYFSMEEMNLVSNAIVNRLTEFKSRGRVVLEQNQRRLDILHGICRTGNGTSPPPSILRQTLPSALVATESVKMTQVPEARHHQRNPLNLWMTGVPLHQLCKISLYRVVLTPRAIGLLTKSLRSESSCCKDFRLTDCVTTGGTNVGAARVLDSLVINGLLHSSTIETLFLNKLNIGGAPLQSISMLLGRNESIRHLQLWSNEMRDDMAILIAKGLSVNRGLQRLSIPNNRFSTIGMQILCAACKQQGCLHELDLSENDLHSDIRYILSHVLLQSSTLATANNNNIIGSSLTALHLQSTELKDDGTCAIASMLQAGIAHNNNSALRTLNLADNGIGVRGGVALAEALRENQTLQRLDFSRNHFSLKIVDAFLETLSSYNYTLFELDLDACPDTTNDQRIEEEEFRSKYHYRSRIEFNSRLTLVHNYLLCNQCGRYLLRGRADDDGRDDAPDEVPLGIWAHVFRACATKQYRHRATDYSSGSHVLPTNYELLRYFISNKPELFQSSQDLDAQDLKSCSSDEVTYSC